jgi:hypothetical protein
LDFGFVKFKLVKRPYNSILIANRLKHIATGLRDGLGKAKKTNLAMAGGVGDGSGGGGSLFGGAVDWLVTAFGMDGFGFIFSLASS